MENKNNNIFYKLNRGVKKYFLLCMLETIKGAPVTKFLKLYLACICYRSL